MSTLSCWVAWAKMRSQTKVSVDDGGSDDGDADNHRVYVASFFSCNFGVRE